MAGENDLAVTDGCQPRCRPLSAKPGRRDAPAAMRGRHPACRPLFEKHGRRTIWQSRMATNPFAGHFQRTLAGETPQRPCVAANPACRPLFEKHGRRNDLAVTDGRQPPCRPLSTNPGRRDAPAAMHGRHPACWPLSEEHGRRNDLAVTNGHQPRLPATSSEPWPARRPSGHAWPPTPLVGHFPRSMAGETIWQSRMAGNPPCRPLSANPGRRDGLATMRGRQHGHAAMRRHVVPAGVVTGVVVAVATRRPPCRWGLARPI